MQAAMREQKTKHVESFVRFCLSDDRITDPDQEWTTLTVSNFPHKYTFTSEGTWKRSSGNRFSLGRMYAVHPNKGDLFYLRVLLCQLTGSDIRTAVLRGLGREQCCVCMDRAVETKLLPYNHAILCRTCLSRLLADRPSEAARLSCPFFRAEVVDHVIQGVDNAQSATVHLLRGGHATFKEACKDLNFGITA